MIQHYVEFKFCEEILDYYESDQIIPTPRKGEHVFIGGTEYRVDEVVYSYEERRTSNTRDPKCIDIKHILDLTDDI